jgi:hypothetical protein
VYGHSGDDGIELNVYQDRYNSNFSETIHKMRSYGGNQDDSIMEEVYSQVRSATQDRIIFVVLSDGAPNCDIDDMKRIMEKLKRDEFVTVGVGILDYHVRDIYHYNTIVKSLHLMPKQVSHLINHVVKMEFK